MKKFYVCRCFYRDNVFVKALNCHVSYEGKERFLLQNRQLLRDKGIVHESEKESLIKEIETEIERRKNLGPGLLERQQAIKKNYNRLHPHIFSLKDEFLDPAFLKLAAYSRQPDAVFEEAFDYVQETDISRMYAVKVFTEEFCRLFLEEIKHFQASDCPKGRPNTMNRYGVLLEELGFESFITDLRENYLQSIYRLLFPDWVGSGLDSHKAFIVHYNQDGDKDLSYHYDNAELTLNVPLSPETSYDGGDLYFGGMRTDGEPSSSRRTYKHQSMVGVLHRGQHMHGASPIVSGDRNNLIVWMRSSSIRNKLCPMCDDVPELVETVGCGDGFTKPVDLQPTVDVCSLT